jgi:cytochrome b
LLVRRLGLWRMLLQKAKLGQWTLVSFWVTASSWALSAAEALLYSFSAVAIASGVAHYNELLGDGVLDEVVQELHEGLGNASLAMVVFHVGLVVALRVWRGPLAVRPMWRGNANTSG